MVKGVEKKSDAFLTHLDFAIQPSPVIALEQSKHEIVRMDEKVRIMFDDLKNIIQNPGNSKEAQKAVFEREDILDNVQKEIIYLGLLKQVMNYLTKRKYDITLNDILSDYLKDEICYDLKKYKEFILARYFVS